MSRASDLALAALLAPACAWIRRAAARGMREGRSPGELGFARLPLYFSPARLAGARAVAARPPLPPLSRATMRLFARGEPLLDPAGITYLSAYFIVPELIGDESIHFHELIHVIQWERLGAKPFLMAYASGFLEKGYRYCPLEDMAYRHQARFDAGAPPYDVEAEVLRELEGPIRPAPRGRG